MSTDLPDFSALTANLEVGIDLLPAQVETAVAALLDADLDDPTKAAFLNALRAKGESAVEIACFARALLDRAIDPEISPKETPGPLLDVCGTGGDKLHIFNVSTAAMFVLAAGGAAVVKHGNRAITSKCGGADVLEALGVRIDLPPAALRECVKQNGVGFLFAPAYHPAFKAIGPVRKQLAAEGRTTIFNLLGPLLNPARPGFQLIGLYSRELLPKYAEALSLLGRTRAWVGHGSGMDELTTTGPSEVCEVSDVGLNSFTIHPDRLGLAHASIEELLGGDCERNAEILEAVVSGEMHGAKREIVLLNAGAGFVVCGLADDLPAGIALAADQIDSGKAKAKLDALRTFSAQA